MVVLCKEEDLQKVLSKIPEWSDESQMNYYTQPYLRRTAEEQKLRFWENTINTVLKDALMGLSVKPEDLHKALKAPALKGVLEELTARGSLVKVSDIKKKAQRKRQKNQGWSSWVGGFFKSVIQKQPSDSRIVSKQLIVQTTQKLLEWTRKQGRNLFLESEVWNEYCKLNSLQNDYSILLDFLNGEEVLDAFQINYQGQQVKVFKFKQFQSEHLELTQQEINACVCIQLKEELERVLLNLEEALEVTKSKKIQQGTLEAKYLLYKKSLQSTKLKKVRKLLDDLEECLVTGENVQKVASDTFEETKRFAKQTKYNSLVLDRKDHVFMKKKIKNFEKFYSSGFK
mmetsp:Transcript_14146/g.20693  ORF Transcript_14146/g.20693 Transcript_14146/m.20693 type:complete len:342 (+) Transcript_14146:19-1044(+)